MPIMQIFLIIWTIFPEKLKGTTTLSKTFILKQGKQVCRSTYRPIPFYCTLLYFEDTALLEIEGLWQHCVVR